MRGHEQSGRLPVLVLSNDTVSAAIGLAPVCPLTSWKNGRRVYPNEVLLEAGTSSLSSTSLVLCHQLRTVDAERLSPSSGHLRDPELQAAVERAVRLWLDLAPKPS